MPSTANYEEFLEAQAKDAYPAPSEILSAFRKLFFDPSPSMPAIVKEAASPIIQNIPNEPVPQNPDCVYLWRTLQQAVDQFVNDNDKFVHFIVEMQKLPDGNHVFKRLPQFRNHWTEFGYTSTTPASVK
jgi:hypothetical protein